MRGTRHVDVAFVGSGFASSILARILARAGWRVLMIDRQRHPRFAIGESSTPLGNLSLERLSRRYEMPELFALAAHGRWLEAFPEVGRGLKRGFSFYRHEADHAWLPSAANAARLLVAASPNDHVADTHWLRAEVDRLLADQARADGVELLEGVVLESARARTGRLRLAGEAADGPIEVDAGLVIDGSGAGGFLAGQMGIGPGPELRTVSRLLFGHFRGVPLLDAIAPGADQDDDPYPQDWAAVHHLVDEGWLYLLRFDDDLVSAGALLEARGPVDERPPEAIWAELLDRYPTVGSLFAGATPERPLAAGPRVQRRLERVHGPRWVVLPHTFGFVDPLFSTGIAWSLLGVERLADALLAAGPASPGIASGGLFDRYANLLSLEIEQMDRLIAGAYRARRSMELFASQAMLYFALVSFEESRQRLAEPASPCWEGFLRADDARARDLLDEALGRLEAAEAVPERFATWITRRIEPWNVAGLADPKRRNLYPVDFDALAASAHKLGLSERQVRDAEPRLRGGLPA